MTTLAQLDDAPTPLCDIPHLTVQPDGAWRLLTAITMTGPVAAAVVPNASPDLLDQLWEQSGLVHPTAIPRVRATLRHLRTVPVEVWTGDRSSEEYLEARHQLRTVAALLPDLNGRDLGLAVLGLLDYPFGLSLSDARYVIADRANEPDLATMSATVRDLAAGVPDITICSRRPIGKLACSVLRAFTGADAEAQETERDRIAGHLAAARAAGSISQRAFAAQRGISPAIARKYLIRARAELAAEQATAQTAQES